MNNIKHQRTENIADLIGLGNVFLENFEQSKFSIVTQTMFGGDTQ